VAAVAYGGQVLLSETAAALVRDSLPAGAALRDLGLHRLKDLGRPEQIFQLQGAGLQAEFPPLRSLGNPAMQNNLPAQLTTFVGRDRELAEIRGLVESCRLVTLTGAGGCGKTRLGLHVAADLLDGTGDGVWLVELAAVSDEQAVAPAVSAALGMALRPGEPVLEALVNALAPQYVLIVLDNCEHLIGACAKIADTILRRCPRVHLIATSREPLGIGGETIYRVPSLSLPGPEEPDSSSAVHSDAVALFVDRAREQGAALSLDERTRSVIVSICRRLDGMPLAIELAAARLRSLSLSELRDRLDQRFRLLTGGSRTALERQQTLRATVDWSYALLTGAEQLLLRRLSVFPESFDLAAAEAVCGFGNSDRLGIAELLGSLVDKSLVLAERTGETSRYRLLQTIRQYAAERLIEAGEKEAATIGAAHCEYFVSVAEQAAPHLTGPDQGRWYARLDLDQANLRRAAEHAAADPGGTARALRLGVALMRYRMARSQGQEALRLLAPALERPEALAEPSLLAAALSAGSLAAQGTDIAAARDLGERSVELARQVGDDQLLITALAIYGSSYCFAGQPERGIAFGQESVERARQLGDDILLGQSLMAYLMCHDSADPAGCEPLYAEAIECTERSGDRLVNRFLHNNAGNTALIAGDLPAARAHLQQAARAAQEIGERSSLGSIMWGWVLRGENDAAAARSMFEAALRTSRRNGERSGMAYSSLGLACVAADSGDWYRACKLHGAAQALLDRTGESWQQPEARYREASLQHLRARLGDQQVDRAYAEGRALTFDAALRLALGQVNESLTR
jgi:predicted ATPase